jgi:nascent polypeptide-associated complex subunit alpha
MMMPGGGGGFNPQQLQKMMKQFGIDVTQIDDVERVVIETPEKDIVIEPADVSIMDAKGQRTYQVTGEPSEVEKDTGPDEEDVELVMEQASVDRDEAVEALEAAGGEPAQAIMDLTEG